MNKEAVTKIIEAALTSGTRTPGLFDLPKILAIKTEIQSCTSINDVLGLVEEHRNLIAKVFGLREELIDDAVSKIKALEG